MLSKLKKYIFPDPNYPRPPMQEGEEIVAEDGALFVRGFGGGRGGPLILTNRRLIWYEDIKVWPMKPISGEINLRDITSVSTNGIIGFVFGGTRLKVRVRKGRTRLFWPGRAPLDTWVAALREASAKARDTRS